tara:strand:- start:289 stop:516 length:228 start_codon:yes stop_codon:yes gene_type:complete
MTTPTTPQVPSRANGFKSGRLTTYEISVKHKTDKQLDWLLAIVSKSVLYAKDWKALTRLDWQIKVIKKEIANRAK